MEISPGTLLRDVIKYFWLRTYQMKVKQLFKCAIISASSGVSSCSLLVQRSMSHAFVELDYFMGNSRSTTGILNELQLSHLLLCYTTIWFYQTGNILKKITLKIQLVNVCRWYGIQTYVLFLRIYSMEFKNISSLTKFHLELLSRLGLIELQTSINPNLLNHNSSVITQQVKSIRSR